MNITEFFWAGICSRCFACIHSFNQHSRPQRRTITPISQMGNLKLGTLKWLVLSHTAPQLGSLKTCILSATADCLLERLRGPPSVKAGLTHSCKSRGPRCQSEGGQGPRLCQQASSNPQTTGLPMKTLSLLRLFLQSICHNLKYIGGLPWQSGG